jgi:hypothetical protein
VVPPDAGREPFDAPTVDLPDAGEGRDVDAARRRVDAMPKTVDAALPIDAARPVDARVPIDAAPACTPTWVSVLQNGSFELGTSPWRELVQGVEKPGDIIRMPPSLPITAKGGDYAAWMGGMDDANDVLSQTPIQIPAGATQLRMKGHRLIATQEFFPFGFDTVSIELWSPGGTRLETLQEWSDVDSTDNWTSFQKVCGLSYAGESIVLYLHAQTDVSASTSFFFDELALEALVCQ